MSYLIAYVIIGIFSCLMNLVTLNFVFKSFNIKTHVFALLFLDSLNCSICAIISTITDAILLSGKLGQNYALCSVSFFVSYLPNSFGSVLTLLIALTRYTLTLKSAKNIRPSNAKVTALGLGIFATAVVTIISFFVYHFKFDIPTAYYIEACAYYDEEPRLMSKLTIFFLFHPNFLNVLSLLTDIRMLIFLKKVIMPLPKNEILEGPGKIFLIIFS